jgi:hypothetical protein
MTSKANGLGKTCQLRVYEKRKIKGTEQGGRNDRENVRSVNKRATRHQQDINTFSACQIDGSTQLKRV